MSIDRFATTRVGAPRALLGLLGCGAALAGAVAVRHWRHQGHGHRCHHGAHAESSGPAHDLHVELAHAEDAGRLAGAVELLGGRAVRVHPMFAHPEPELVRWYDVIVQGDPDRLAGALRADGIAVEAFEAPTIGLASIDPGAGSDQERFPRPSPPAPVCPIKTPPYHALQGYLGPAPGGIDAAAVWDQPGGRGQGVRFADIEGGWNVRHEDLPGDRIQVVSGSMDDRAWEAHGTAVVGEVAGRDNGLGMTGIAPDVERIVVSSIGTGTGYRAVADAIDQAQQQLRGGDVLLIELQGLGPERRWIPVEFWPDVYDTIRVASARGVIVIEAAGNGAANLDARAYGGVFDPDKRDSGAIMVGAGGPPRPGFTDRARLDFSNYGRRVDVQGWGRKVATLDYGDLQQCADRADRHYTGEFSGTSSASPIIAGAAIQIQGVYFARTGMHLSPPQMRAVMKATGSPQVGARGAPLSQQIGPRPNVPAALAALLAD